MTQLDQSDPIPADPLPADPLPADLLQPTLQLLGETIDREFARREPTRPTFVEWAATRLGLPVSGIALASELVEPPVADAVGAWLLQEQRRLDASAVGADPSLPPSEARVAGSQGDVATFRAATVALPPGALHAGPLVVRVLPHSHAVEVQLLGPRAEAEQLGRTLAGLLRARRAAGSPYHLGSYRVGADHRGLTLDPVDLGAATRETLQLQPEVWYTVDRHVHRVLALSEDLRARGLGTSAGVLLVGPPGTGKTQLGTVVAGELRGRATVLVPGSNVTELWLTELFDLAADLAPALILMDDLDLIAGERGTGNPHRLREFLNVMDGGLADRSGVVVIASTNDHRKVDKAARRSSRFDTVIRLEAPGYDGRLSILRRYLGWCDTELDLAAVARATGGATGADLKELVRTTVLETEDRVTTQALLAQAAAGPWAAEPAPAGVYL